MITGRPPRPDHLRVGPHGKIEGTPSDPILVDLYSVDPEPPAWLSEKGKEIFLMFVYERLKPYGLAGAVDTELLAVLAAAMEEYRLLYEDVRLHGYSEPTAGGGSKTRPEASALRSSITQVKQLLEQFGLSPSARARVKPTKSPNTGGGAKGDFGDFN